MDDWVHNEADSAATKIDPFTHRVLKHYAFYADGSQALRQGLRRVVRPARIDAGQHVLETGRACGDVLLVGRGSVRVYISGPSGREVTLYHIRRGETCPVNLSAALVGVGAFANATATGDVEALTIPVIEFVALGKTDRRLQDFIFAETVMRFGEVITLIREITTRPVDHRLADYLIALFEKSELSPPVAAVTQQSIALELGTAREVVSRRLHELERLGAVRLERGKICLENLDVLRSVL